MRLYPNDAEMFRQRQHHPIAKVFVQCDKNPFFPHSAFEDQRVIRPCLSDFRCANNIMSRRTQPFSQFGPQHLVQVKAHGQSSRVKSGDFRVQNGTAGVIQNRLDIRALQFRVAAQNGIPRFIFGQLLQNGSHGNSRAFNDGLASTNARVDFNSFAHALNNTPSA